MSFGFSNTQKVFKVDFSSYNAPATCTGQGTWSNNTNAGFTESGDCSGTGCVLSQILTSTESYTSYGGSTKMC